MCYYYYFFFNVIPKFNDVRFNENINLACVTSNNIFLLCVYTDPSRDYGCDYITVIMYDIQILVIDLIRAKQVNKVIYEVH